MCKRINWYDPIYTEFKEEDLKNFNINISDLVGITIDAKNNVNIPFYKDFSNDQKKIFNNYTEKLRTFLLNNYTNKRQPVGGGNKNVEEIVDSLKKFKDLDVSDTYKEIDGNKVLMNFNKFGSAINHWFPEMLDTKILQGTDQSKARSVIDLLRDKNRFHKFMEQMTLPEINRMYAYILTFDNFIFSYKPPKSKFYLIKTIDDLKELYWYYSFKIYKEELSSLVPKELLESFTYTNINENTNKELIKDILLKFKSDNKNIHKTKKSYNESEKIYLKEIKKILKDSNKKSSLTFHEYVKKYYKNTEELKELFSKWIDNLKTQKVMPDLTHCMRLGGGSQPAVNFPPAIAKWIYENCIPIDNDKKDIIILDPCSGWGGRLMGFLAASSNKYKDKHITYLGTDVNSETHTFDNKYRFGTDPENILLKNDNINIDFNEGMVPVFWNENIDNILPRVKIFKSIRPAQQILDVYRQYAGSVDLAMTSPPYYNRELYSDDKHQSYKLGSYEDWVDEFLKPFMINVYTMLKKDGLLLLNIADINVGTKVFNLEKDSIDIAQSLGFKYEDKYHMIMSTMVGNDANKKNGSKNKININGKKYKFEPIFVLRK